MNVKNIRSISDMQHFVEGCLNDYGTGISTKEETMKNMEEYTSRVIEVTYDKVSEYYTEILRRFAKMEIAVFQAKLEQVCPEPKDRE